MGTELNLLDRVFHVLADLPEPEAVLAIQTTEEENRRLDYLQERKRLGQLTPEEQQEIENYILAEDYVRLAKAKAFAKLRRNHAA